MVEILLGKNTKNLIVTISKGGCQPTSSLFPIETSTPFLLQSKNLLIKEKELGGTHLTATATVKMANKHFRTAMAIMNMENTIRPIS